MTEKCRIFDMGYKEVINLEDGLRLGFINDAEIDLESGHVTAFVIPGKKKLWGLLGREEDIMVSWEEVEKVGTDIILIRRDSGVKRLPERKFYY